MKRILSGIILAFLLIGTLLLRSVSLSFFDALMGIVIVFASFEICNALEKRGNKNIKYISMIYPIFMYILYITSINNQHNWGIIILNQTLLIVLFFIATLFTQFIIQLISNRKLLKKNRIKVKTNLKNSSIVAVNTLITFIYPSLLLGLFFVLNHLSEFSFAQNNTAISLNIETFLIALVFVITFSTDIFALCVGSVFKGPKLCPLISPKKTISGAIGGIIASVFCLTLGFYILIANSAFNAFFQSNGLTLLTFIILAIIGSIISQLGDLFASLIKRKCGIKDFGSILPGHGGILDRFDGISFNIVFVLLFSCILLF